MDEPASYEIRVAEEIDARWEKWFEGLEITRGDSGGTILRGVIVDPPALYGVIGQIRDLGLTLISIQRQ